MRRTGVALLIACLLGIPAGVGAFTFVDAKGLSYLSTDPRACVNCLIKTPQDDAWPQSGHRHVAAESSMGFHAPQELARILGETIDLARQGQLEAERAARKK